MSWGFYVILFLVGLFFLLLIFSPNLSCFGKKLRSPFYPLFRKKKLKKIRTHDYGFSLTEEGSRRKTGEKAPHREPGQRDTGPETEKRKEKPGPKKKLKTHDYGFSLDDDEEHKKPG